MVVFMVVSSAVPFVLSTDCFAAIMRQFARMPQLLGRLSGSAIIALAVQQGAPP
jgi:hypothetical protein